MQPRTVLLIEDDEDNRDSLGALLGDAGYEVRLAHNGHHALEQLRAGPPPDVILLDLVMPRMDGYEFRRQQRSDPKLAAIPTLVLSAGAIDNRVQDMSVDGWLTKPVYVPGLLAAIERSCSKAAGTWTVVPGPEGRGEARVALPGAPEHLVHFYDDEAGLVSSVARFLAQGIRASEAVVIIATAAHRSAISAHLAASGIDLDAVERAGRAALLDAETTLQRISLRGRPAHGPFTETVGKVLAALSTASGASRIRAYGEMVNLLWTKGDVAGAILLEELWNGLRGPLPFSLLCGYSVPAAPAARLHPHPHPHPHLHPHPQSRDSADLLRIQHLHPAGLLGEAPSQG
jgi:CheY-like chemotaxis protein